MAIAESRDPAPTVPAPQKKPEAPRPGGTEPVRTFATPPRWPAILALVASVMGLAFAISSATDYAHHLDRQIHDVHCSFVPGLGGEQGADNPCRVAMYSPYAAVFRDRYWGGVPIALFAVGAFCFFAGFSLWLILAPN